jgi:asparagine synthetase A
MSFIFAISKNQTMKPIRNDSYEEGVDISFEDYLDIWDYASLQTIPEDWWDSNIEMIMEMHNEMYRLFTLSESSIQSRGSKIRFIGKNLEIIFSTLKKYGKLKD